MNTLNWQLRTDLWTEALRWSWSSWAMFATALLCLVMLIWLILQLTTRLTEDMDPAEADRQMLLSLDELHREGDLTTEEFRSLKGQLVQRISGDTPCSKKAETSAGTAESAMTTVDDGAC